MLERFAELKRRIHTLHTIIEEYEREANDIYFKGQLWLPMQTLTLYHNKTLSSIDIIYKLSDEPNVLHKQTLKGDILQVKEDGSLFYSDYNDGIISKIKDSYTLQYLGNETPIDLIGVDNIKC